MSPRVVSTGLGNGSIPSKHHVITSTRGHGGDVY